MPEDQKLFILEGIKFILKHNVFDFNNQLNIQTKETAMGTRFAPSLANLYMGQYEDLFIINQHQWRDKIIIYKRNIDDLLFVWDGTEPDFEAFKGHLNTNNWGLTLSGKINANNINYLYITLSSKGEKVITKCFFQESGL